jgi:hypothetical protein
MASTFIYINVKGDGSISWVSSSIGGKLIRSIDTNGSGEFLFGYDYKFLTNKIVVGFITSSSPANCVIWNPVDESFKVSSNAQTASINVVFTPQKEPNFMFVPKPSTYGKSNALSIANFNFLPYVSPIGTEPVQAGITLPTDADYSAGYMFRYFYKQTNNPSALVKEITKTQFDTLGGVYFYKTLEIKWKIAGNDIKTKEINADILEIADQTLPGIKSILQRNLLQYWQTGSSASTTQFNVTAQIKTQNMVQ